MKAIKLLLVMLASLIVVACGGGGGSSPAASTTLSGTAAVGAPIVGATVTVKCAAGTSLSNIPSTSATGAWSVTLSGQTLPCAVQVSGGTIRGAANTITYQSIANAYGIVNVTPLTDLLVANLAGSAVAAFTPAQLAAITPANIATALTKLRSASTGGVATFTDTYTSGGTTYPTDTGTLQLDAAGAWTATIGTYTVTILPATFVVGTTWISKPGNTTGNSPTTSTIAAFNVTRTVPAGTFTDCLQINETSSYTNAGVTTISNSTSYYSPTAGIWIETIHVGGGTEQLQTYGTVQVNGTAAQYFSKKAVGNTWTWNWQSSNATTPDVKVRTVTASTGSAVTTAYTYTAAGGTTPPPRAETLKLDAATGAWVITSGTFSSVILPATFSVGTTWISEPADPTAGTSAVTDTVKAFNVTRTVPAGTFTDCLQVDSTFSYTNGSVTTAYNSTRYYSPTVGLYVDGVNYGSNGVVTGTEKLQAGYIANP